MSKPILLKFYPGDIVFHTSFEYVGLVQNINHTGNDVRIIFEFVNGTMNCSQRFFKLATKAQIEAVDPSPSRVAGTFNQHSSQHWDGLSDAIAIAAATPDFNQLLLTKSKQGSL